MKTKPNFYLTEKYFPLTNFSNDKQTQESLENGIPKTTFLNQFLESLEGKS